MKLQHIVLFISTIGLFTACDISDNDIEPSESFFRIYDNNEFNASFIPLDVIQTADEGFLILSGTRQETSDFVGVRIIKADQSGNFIQQSTLGPDLVHPVANWIERDSVFYFFCMEATSLQAQLYSLDQDGNLNDPVNVGLTLPQYATRDEDEFLVLSYDNANRTTVLSLINPDDGSITSSQSFTIGDGDGAEEPVVDHYTRTGKQLPFTAGRLDNGTYYFNGFFNFTLSLVFTDLQNGVAGVVQGQQEDGGFSALMPLAGSNFAAARFNFGDNFFVPNASLDAAGTTSSVDVAGNPMLELVPDARVYIERMTIDDRATLVYASTTKNGQIILTLYDESDGSWLGTDYLGFSNPFEVRSIHQTMDGGLALLAETSVVGRFPRASLFKLSPNDLEDIISVD